MVFKQTQEDYLLKSNTYKQCCGAEIIHFWLQLHFLFYIGSGSGPVLTVKNETKNFCETTFKRYSES